MKQFSEMWNHKIWNNFKKCEIIKSETILYIYIYFAICYFTKVNTMYYRLKHNTIFLYYIYTKLNFIALNNVKDNIFISFKMV